jgi:thiamine-phosphate pyrophosphorylase
MAPLLYLITPSDPDLAQFPRLLMAVLSGPEVSALLVQRGTLDDAAYAALDDVTLARSLKADGVHVTKGGVKAIREAVAALKPEGIVGVGNIGSRHDAMSFGELDVDYLMFGPLGGKPDSQAAALAEWWAETFEIPAVHSIPDADPALLSASLTEFIGLSDCVWTKSDPAEALKLFDRAAQEQA